MVRADMHDALEMLAEQGAGDPRALVNIAKAMTGTRPDRAAALVHDVLAMGPAPSIAREAETLLKEMVPDWHFVIVRDHARNQAYDQALRRAVTPQSRVLDIGTGTGLLAMMAARAGAQDVVTCEQNAAVAGAATRILDANGFADRVRLIPRHSSDLDVEQDLGGAVDVLVSEIVSNNLIGEGCLAVMEESARWLKPDGRMIPEAGTVRVALAWSSALEKRRMGIIDGFDLSGFNVLEAAVWPHAIGDPTLDVRSSSADLMQFDFRSGGPFRPAEQRATVVADGGPINGVLQWIHLKMDDEIVYENRPGPGASSCWATLFYPFRDTMEVVAGQAVAVVGAHDRETFSIWAELVD